ncbi:MAG: hypothetical protein AAF390_17935 [Pseudomonadota bacterium]
MTLLHASIAAAAPERVARALGRLLGGPALPFPPCPGAWIAFAAADDGSAVEVYPLDRRVTAGPDQIAFTEGPPEAGPVSTHLAIASPLSAAEILACAEAEGWPARRCARGPFDCIEVWVEDRVLVEVLDAEMLADYRSGMTAANWRAMFEMEDSP